MNVRELRELLERYPDNMPVMVDGYEGGLEDLDAECVEAAPVSLNVNPESYYGPHEHAGSRDINGDVTALILHR